jgi:hypothetical protein
MKLIVLIATHAANVSRCKMIDETWGRDLKRHNIDYYFISGDELDLNNTLKINFKESYEQLPLKTLLMLKQISNIDFNYIIKLDDDTFFNIDEFLKTDFINYDYIGKFNLADAKRDSYYKRIHFYKIKNKDYHIDKILPQFDYAQGGFYALSRSAVDYILTHKKELFINTPTSYKGEDELLGEILARQKKYDIKDSYVSSLLHLDATKNGISFHPVHHTLVKPLYKCAGVEEKIKFLKANFYKNAYILRDVILRKYEK